MSAPNTNSKSDLEPKPESNSGPGAKPGPGDTTDTTDSSCTCDIKAVFVEMRERLLLLDEDETAEPEYSLPVSVLAEFWDKCGSQEDGTEASSVEGSCEGDDHGRDDNFKEDDDGEIYEYPSSEVEDEDDVFRMANGDSFENPACMESFVELAEEFYYS